MADLKEKKFGYVVQPPPCPHPHPHPFPPPPGPVPPGMTVQDWMTYINSYIDVRARQLYDKLKKKDVKDVYDYILLKDKGTNTTRKLFVYNDVIYTEDYNEGLDNN